MKNIISSSTFSPKYDLCHFFSFSIEFPKELHTVPTINKSEKCTKCNSYLLQSEHICPICDPINYFHKKQTTFFNSFRINMKSDYFGDRIFLIIFDLDLPTEELHSFSEILLKEGKKEEFKNAFFLIVFFGYQISFLNCIDEQIQFEFIPSIKSFNNLIKPLDYFEKYLTKAFKIAKSYIKTTNDKKTSMENFFSMIQKDSNFHNVQDIIYVYSDSFPSQIKYTFRPRFHLIQISEQISKLNIDFACRFKASFFSSPHANESVSHHLNKILTNETILSPHLTISSSPGIIFKDLSGSIQSLTQESENLVNVELFSSFNQSIPVFSCSKTDKKRYNSSKYFSYQLVLHYFRDCIFVFNDVYEKANTIAEWIQSFNRDFFLFTIFQSYANDLLNANIHLNSSWKVINRNIKIGKDFNKFYTFSNSIRKFFNELFHSSSTLLTENQKAYILFSFCYGELHESIEFISSIFGDSNSQINDNSQSIAMKPFLIINECAKLNEIVGGSLISCPILEKRNPQQFSTLKEFIRSYQKELQTYDSLSK